MSGLNYSSQSLTKQDLVAVEGYLNRTAQASKNQLTSATGVETVPRLLVTTGTQALAATNTTLLASYFICPSDVTVSNFNFALTVAGTAASVAASGFCRIGLCIPSGLDSTTMTVIARSANSAASLLTANTATATVPFEASGIYPASVGLVAGQQYAIVVWTSSMGTAFTVTPSFAAVAAPTNPSLITTVGPRTTLTAAATATTDLPATLTIAAPTSVGTSVYWRLS